MPPHEIVQALEIHEISVDEASELAFCCDLLELFDTDERADLMILKIKGSQSLMLS